MYDAEEGGDSIIMEVDATWASHQDVQLTVRLLPKHVPGLPESVDVSQLVLRALNKFVFVRVCISISVLPPNRFQGVGPKPSANQNPGVNELVIVRLCISCSFVPPIRGSTYTVG